VSVTVYEKQYNLSASSTNVSEGETFTITLNTLYVPDGSQVGYTISGVTAEEISVPLTGNLTVTGDTATIDITVSPDVITGEADKTLVFSLDVGIAIFVTVKDATPAYLVESDVSSVNEGGTVTFTLTTSFVDDDTLVPYTITGIQASDLVENTLTGNFTVAGGTATAVYNIVEDFTTENTETMTLALDNGVSEVDVTVFDTSVPTYTLTTSAAGVLEGESFTITLTTQGVADSTQVPYTVTGINAADLTVGSLTGNFTIVNNEATATFTTNDDGVLEGPETFTLTLDNVPESIDVLVQEVIPADPYWADTRLLMSFDEQDTQSLIDKTGKHTTIYSNPIDGAELSTTEKAFGVSSLSITGPANHIWIPISSADAFGAGDFTIELWANIGTPADSNRDYIIFTGEGNRYSMAIESDRTISMSVYTTLKGKTSIPLPNGEWSHIAVSRSGTNVKIFINGVEGASYSDNTTYDAGSWYIGTASYSGGSNSGCIGLIDELRITKGVARYTTDFAVPVYPFSDF